MIEQIVVLPEVPVEASRNVSGNYLALAALHESVVRRVRQARARSPESELDKALWQVERQQRLAELHRHVSVALVGYAPNPFDPNGR
jgi:hypothetical protein